MQSKPYSYMQQNKQQSITHTVNDITEFYYVRLRTRRHDFVLLPTTEYEFNIRHFIVRSLFSYV